ncbi:pentatricopeptide repeat-containing protein 2, mitochondrial-like [Malaya genurostris]|uniref:pentatricopeptide repeat-containing protein 2, mitochondrial-like n=1 Tax=Malaya genurostris TaxID=325434 RepID=UPI0026F3E9BE|nr:pentatricopeptide repeat-containing protein 2, mitochondrial-like [Malaya genurostris]XP_058466634.1 pentatricopeptide repeat-containing protein 2, mitochondrial-like [Malaya genurostris]
MFRNSLTSLVRQSGYTNVVARNLYSASVLGLDGYKNYREKTKTQYMHNIDNFKRKMREFVAGSNTNMIFTEDLKNVVHLVENTPEDKKLLLDMIDKYNSQGQELRFGNYIFGPVVMRALYFLDDPELAVKLFKDEKYKGFFDQLSTYQILGDLLYQHGQYSQVRELFDVIKTRQVDSGRYPRYSVTLTFAACYKENSEESFQYAMSLWKELNAMGHTPMRKAIAFAAALALKHNKPDIALEITSSLSQANYVTIRQIKILALVALGRLDDIVPIFRAVLEVGGPLEKKQTFCREVIQQLNSRISSKDSEIPQDMQRMLEYLETNGHINDSTLDELLCQDIVTAPRKETYNNLAESYKSRGGTQQLRSFAPNRTQRSRFSRPGLADMN